MSNQAMSALAAQVPTSIPELSDLGKLGETVIQDYGERLVKNITAYIKQENLEKYVERRRAAKRPRKGKENDRPGQVNDEGNEFDAAGIDFAAIDLPDEVSNAAPAAAAAAAPAATKPGKKGGNGTKSSYF